MSKTILVIDDDPAVLQSYGRLLRRLGHTVRLLADVDEAHRDPALLERVDLLILDQRMPGMSGLDLLAVLRGRAPEVGAEAAVLLISAYLSEELREQASHLGVVEVIEKPVDPEHLLGSVRAALAAGGGAARSAGGSRP